MTDSTESFQLLDLEVLMRLDPRNHVFGQARGGAAVLVLSIASFAALLGGCARGGGTTDGGPRDTGVPRPDTGTPPVDSGSDRCAAIDCSGRADACNDAACDPATGECVVTPRADGTACGEAERCLSGGRCSGGVCQGTPVPEGNLCDDGDACTTGERCTAGACGGGTTPDCSSLDSECATGTCNPTTGACEAVPATDGTGCDDGSACTSGDVCTGGTCAGSAVDCSVLDGPCTTGTCSPVRGACEAVPAMDGTGCDDGSACTSGDVCVAGVCAGAAVDCSGLGAGCTVGVCDLATGMCTTATASDGTSCDDGSLCTVADVCTGGTCAGRALDCSSLTDPCNAGVCDPATGMCSTSAAPDGTSCDDGSLCTTGDVCTGGACAGTTLDCSGSSTECAPSVCDAATGACAAGTPLAVCTTCSAGYCAPDGSCQTSVGSILYDFETGLPAGWTTSGSASWFASTTTPYAGSRAAESGDIGDSQSTSLTAPVDFGVEVQLSFWFRTSSETSYDLLLFFVDGVERQRWSGTNGWTEYTTTLTAGPHTLEWRYSKDSSVSSGSDTVWIDDVRVQPLPRPTVVASFDFESGALPAGFTTSGAATWRVTTTTARTGTRSAASGDITHSQSSSLSYGFTLANPGELRFGYSVSSESSYDYLRFFLDGVQQAQWSGTVAWAEYRLAVAAGAHTAEWRYVKDGSLDGGSDTAWIDDVTLWESIPDPSANLCAP